MSEIKAIVKGILSYIPGVNAIGRREGGGANFARYCYSVWLRHLVLANSKGLDGIPVSVAELGPGDSLGTGIASLLSGVKTYYAFDVVSFIRSGQNLKILEEIIVLFKKKTPIPDESEFPLLSPKLSDYTFPSHILTDQVLAISLSEKWIEEIRNALNNLSTINNEDSIISYFAPWTSNKVIRESSIELIISQAVFEHVDDLKTTYQIMNRWLKLGGFSSHQIDFKSHGYAKEWYGHWCYNGFKWGIIKGNRPYLLNREPLSTHLKLNKDFGFKVERVLKRESDKPAKRERLAKKFEGLTDEDLITSSAYILSVKKSNI